MLGDYLGKLQSMQVRMTDCCQGTTDRALWVPGVNKLLWETGFLHLGHFPNPPQLSTYNDQANRID
eukprot:15324825-Ditylum_brightwellii.AAC.1